MSFSSDRLLMTVVGITSRSTYKENMNEKCEKYARPRAATYTTVHRRETGRSGAEKAIFGSAEPI